MTNVVVLRGRLSRPAVERVLPSGDRLAILELTVPARPGDERARAESVPLSWVEAPAWVDELGPGSELVVVGRVRRRFFRAGTTVQSRTEVVVEGAVPARQAGRASALMRRAVDAVGEGATVTGARSRRRAALTFE